MRKIITNTMITLDGVMQAPGGSKEDAAEGFKYGGWQGNYWNEEADKIMNEKVQNNPFDLLLGRKTYDIFSGYWPLHADEPTWGAKFDKAVKYVVSHNQIETPWKESKLITGDVIEELKKLKESDGPDFLIYGSWDLIQQLLKEHMIDVLHIWTYPLTVGNGKRLFDDGTQALQFKEIDHADFSTGLKYASYEPGENLTLNNS